MISVVIPYYQRQAGVLRRALASIAAQINTALPVEVIVVDDASPAPAHAELAAMQWPQGMGARLIQRANGGPGAARNTGLDAVSPATQYLAFLDSDDEWLPQHLVRAVAALDMGYDFFFADLYHIDQQTSAFVRGGRLNLAEHPQLETPFERLHAYQGDLFDQTLRGNVIGTPTVVYRWPLFRSERFKVEFTSAGEDYLFWMTLARAGAQVAFSSEVGARCGRGVNVYSGSGWGTPGHLLRLHQEILFRKTVRQLFSLNAVQDQHIQSELNRLRLAFARDLLHRLRHRTRTPAKLLAAHAQADPMTFGRLPLSVLQIVARR